MSTREEWLLKAVDELRSGLFQRNNATVPLVRVSVGFPGGSSRHTAIGQYWHSRAVQDRIPQIFVSPILEDPQKVLDVLVHELIHAVHPNAGHRGDFKRLALKVGLTGRMTHTTSGPELKQYLRQLAQFLGKYPNSKINLSGRKKQPTRLCKVECDSCGYVCRITAKWIIEVGTPICPCSMESMIIRS